VFIDVHTIYEVNYEAVFDTFSSELEERIKVPEFADTMQNDFSTSSPSHKIASQINLMASLQEFFTYQMGMSGCGIKGVEMLGKVSDWDKLKEKLDRVRKLLAPIEDKLKRQGLDPEWWDHVSDVFENLALTYKQPKTPTVRKFWADILMHSKDWAYGPSGMSRGEVEAYNGWLIKFLLGQDSILVKDMQNEKTLKKLSGLNEVPLNIVMTWCSPPIEDEAQLVSGIMGFTFHPEKATFNGVPSLQPHHMWAMMLPPDSPLRESGD
jgi:hypothetical protein